MCSVFLKTVFHIIELHVWWYYTLILNSRIVHHLQYISDHSFTVMPNFAEKVEIAVDSLSANPPREVDENEFIDASRLVYDGVRDIRRAVLLNRVSVARSRSLEWSKLSAYCLPGRTCMHRNFMKSHFFTSPIDTFTCKPVVFELIYH